MMISRRVNREAVIVLGWGRAILLQLAHPLVAAGVGAHSDFDAGPLAYVRRMRRTIGAMLSLTFGTESEIRQTAGRINAIHHRVHGRLDCAVGGYAAGTPYDATDPALLTWVHATLVDSQLRTYALFVGPLAPADEDRYCAEAAQIGPLLGVPSNTLPDTKDRLDRYLDRMQQDDRLAVGACARRLAGTLLAPPGRRWVAPALWFGRLTTVGLLPASIRDAYGFPWRTKDAGGCGRPPRCCAPPGGLRRRCCASGPPPERRAIRLPRSADRGAPSGGMRLGSARGFHRGCPANLDIDHCFPWAVWRPRSGGCRVRRWRSGTSSASATAAHRAGSPGRARRQRRPPPSRPLRSGRRPSRPGAAEGTPSTSLNRLNIVSVPVQRTRYFWHNTHVRRGNRDIPLVVTLGVSHADKVEPVTALPQSGRRAGLLHAGRRDPEPSRAD